MKVLATIIGGAIGMMSAHVWADPLSPCTGDTVYSAPATAGPLKQAWPLDAEDRMLWQSGEPTVIDDKIIAHFPAGSINPGNRDAPQGGLGFRDQFGEHREGCLTYELRFAPDFEFAKGGKLPGLYGGTDFSGCTDKTARGFSTRLMWGKRGTFFLYPYFADRDSRCGEVHGSGIVYAAPGAWHRIEQRIRLNDEGQANGAITTLIDGQVISVLEGRAISPGVAIEGLVFSTFFGGSNASWASPKDQSISFRSFRFALP